MTCGRRKPSSISPAYDTRSSQIVAGPPPMLIIDGSPLMARTLILWIIAAKAPPSAYNGRHIHSTVLSDTVDVRRLDHAS